MKKLITILISILVGVAIPLPIMANQDSLQNNWNTIPKNVQNLVISRNTEIRCDEILTYQLQARIDGGNPNMSAYCVQRKSNGVVYLNAIHICDGYETYLSHEIGHILSTYNNDLYYWSKTPQFIEIWQKERGFFNTPYLDNDNIEYFAECFRWYCLIPSALEDKAPETYKYINGVVGATK